MKYALIGCGRIAINHLKAAVANHLEITALCDVLPEHIDILLGKQPVPDADGISRYTDYREMIEAHPEIELCAIATPSGLHAEIALYLIDRGIHVIIEKPIAMSIADAEEIIRRSEEKGVTVCACHQNRFNFAVQKVRKALEEGRFGKLSHGAVTVRWNRSEAYYDQASWRGTWAQDGGCLMNQCIHGIDLLRWMMGGEPETVYGVTRKVLHDHLEVEDVGMAVVTFRNGTVATIEGTVNVYPTNLEETLCLFGEKGTVRIGGKAVNTIDVWQFSDEMPEDEALVGQEEKAGNVYGNGHTGLYADVIDAIRSHRKPYVDARAGRDALEMVLAIYKSMKTGLPVSLPLKDFSTEDMKGIF